MKSALVALLPAVATTAMAARESQRSSSGVSPALQNILANTDGSKLYQYPTDLTRGIIPKQLHSHNDYWRDVPFYSALSVGAISVEADVWLVNGTLYVGHEQSALTQDRTLKSLYVDPILDVIKRQNPSTPFIDGSTTKNGVFDTSAGQTLYLFIDLKTSGPETWPLVLQALEPLRSAGYLTTYNGSSMASGPVTVIGTGNTPLAAVEAADPRDAFYDANLALLPGALSNITSAVSPVASTDFAVAIGEVRNGALNETQLVALRGLLDAAHAKGIKARFWDQPGWPVGNRNGVWKTLWEEGADLLNVDDLEAAAAFWEN